MPNYLFQHQNEAYRLAACPNPWELDLRLEFTVEASFQGARTSMSEEYISVDAASSPVNGKLICL
jgi:hypothetical protein